MSSPQRLVIEAGTLYTPLQRIAPARIAIEGTSITEVGAAGDVQIPPGATVIDAKELIATPGFIDPHIHGCGGVDVMDCTYNSLNTISRIVARHGTTSFLPTTVSSPPEVLTSALEKLGGMLGQVFDGAQPAGIHLEGPFISAARRGTHKAAHVLQPDAVLFQSWIRRSGNSIRLITIAPELEDSASLVSAAREAGVTVAMGHSNATLEEAAAAADAGIHYAVHTFNAMREFAHRDPGITGAVLSDDRIYAEIISDGVHVSPSVVRVFARAKPAVRVLLVTDAISATGMADGCYRLGPDTVQVAGGVCRDAEGRLAGSTLTQEVALKHYIEWSGFPFTTCLLGLTTNPARALKLHSKGVLEAGADADVAILDARLQVMKTVVAGRLVFEA